MAEDNSHNSSWLGSWLSAAKVKSSEVFQFVKKDLGEFGQAVKSEATNVVSSTGSVIEKTLGFDEPDSTANSMKRTFSSFIGQMNEALNPSPDDSDTEAILITDGEMVTLTKKQQAVYELQKNDATFLTDPEISLQKRYQCWLEIAEDQLSQHKLERHLTGSAVLNEKYIKLVPEHISHALFWKRYLFKKALIEDDIAMEEVMEKPKIKENPTTEDDLKWEQEDFANDVELTEEEQIRLLEQYELETKLKNDKHLQRSEYVNDDILLGKSPVKSKTKESSDNKTGADIVQEKKITRRGGSSSVGTGSSSSTDDDWEKINDIEK